MTPRETFEFGIRMTSNLNKIETNAKVDEIITRLGLKACQHVYNGGQYIKGISGGEKKRTSIGYELVTNPSLLMLDEPTSGLDSHTALRIAQLLKKES
jgi:ABC-type multidrug transport system ATPase subunit